MRGRIRNLESLVVNLMNQKSSSSQVSYSRSEPSTASQKEGDESPAARSAPPAGPRQEDVNEDSFGQFRISNTGNETSYVGVSHWSAILKEIEEVGKYFDEKDAEAEEPVEETWDTVNQRSTITFGIPKPVSKAVLLAEMPPKEEVDRILPLWFNSSDPLLYIMHAPTFQDEYRQFWKDPTHTPVMWIALLYGAMALGIILGPRNPGFTVYPQTATSFDAAEDSSALSYEAVDRYQTLASSAMALADMAKPQPYTLEAAMIYGECEFLRKNDHHVRIWLMIGIMIRVALRMGYHRDARHFDNITPFQGEMRRRAWHLLYQIDVLVSFAIGLPSMIRRIESDTQPPHNLLDTDFSVHCTELPKERPFSEITPGSYTIAKSRVCAIFAEAAELSQLVVPPIHADILAADQRLQEAYAAIPDGLRVRSMELSITDPPVIIMARFNLELLYQKTRTVLHRKYLVVGQTDPRFAESRKICVDAAMHTLRHQDVIFHACQPGGQLHKVWWYMSSLTTYDFLLASMVVCFELNYIRVEEASPEFKGPPCPFVPEMIRLLKNTFDIWSNHPNRLSESCKAAKILGAMLNKLAGPINSDKDATENGVQENNTALPPDTDILYANQLPTWGPLGDSVDAAAYQITDLSQDIDWTMWDSHFLGQANSLPEQTWLPNSNANMDELLDFDDPTNIISINYDNSTD